MSIISSMIMIAVPILIVAGVIFTFVMMFSPKVRSKFMGSQVRSMKYMLEDNKDDLTDINRTVGSIGIDAQRQIMSQNEDSLRYMSAKQAEINSVGIETTARAFKRGFTEGNSVYCKHCGASIDSDSTFCKRCGRQQ